MGHAIATQEGLSIEYDEDVCCDVCQSVSVIWYNILKDLVTIFCKDLASCWCRCRYPERSSLVIDTLQHGCFVISCNIKSLLRRITAELHKWA